MASIDAPEAAIYSASVEKVDPVLDIVMPHYIALAPNRVDGQSLVGFPESSST